MRKVFHRGGRMSVWVFRAKCVSWFCCFIPSPQGLYVNGTAGFPTALSRAKVYECKAFEFELFVFHLAVLDRSAWLWRYPDISPEVKEAVPRPELFQGLAVPMIQCTWSRVLHSLRKLANMLTTVVAQNSPVQMEATTSPYLFNHFVEKSDTFTPTRDRVQFDGCVARIKAPHTVQNVVQAQRVQTFMNLLLVAVEES